MAYNIENIRTETHPQGEFLFDANVWFYILNPPIHLSREIEDYFNFLELIQNSTHKPKPKIVIPSLILSEVINRYLRSVGMKTFFEENPTKEPYPDERKDRYKDVYRSSDQFKIDYGNICADIKSYNNITEFIDDKFGTFKQKHILTSPPAGLDFNDFYYWKLAKERGYTIVTHDRDFYVPDVKILTSNQKLLDK
ncbi:MAG: PIN domain-containing protein [Saprospiraceae bacterium]|nr:PIN domain-containing protein [Saprospiraceae bacterium]